MTDHLHPGARLLERLEIGWTGTDSELINRAYNFKAWADMHPWGALRWRQKINRAKGSALTGQLYSAIENILEGREEIAALVQHATPARLNERRPATTPAVNAAPTSLISTQAPLIKQARSEGTGLPREYEDWKTKNITAAALAEVKMLAPVRANEALSLEVRAKQATDRGAMHELLKRAAGIWAALLNIKEPVLCRSN